MEVPKLVVLVILTFCITVTKGSVGSVKHGNSYTIYNELAESFLTSTMHTFRPDYGVYPGKVLSTEFMGTLNQIWDVIRWPGEETQHFWVMSKGASLNRISTIYSPGSPIPPKNLIEFIPLNVTVPSDVKDGIISTNSTATVFLIKSVDLNTCVQSLGLDHEVSYTRCNIQNRAQHWFFDYYYEDKKNGEQVPALPRNKLKFYCKFHG